LIKDLILQKAYFFLSSRAYFTTELKKKLLIKFTKESLKDIDIVISKLEAEKILDDSLTAKVYIEELQRRRFGKKYIVNKFLQKGLSLNFAKLSIQTYYDTKIEEDNINYFKQKKLADDSIKQKFKFNNFIKQRGF